MTRHIYVVMEGHTVLTSVDNGYTEYLPLVATQDPDEAARIAREIVQSRVATVPWVNSGEEFARERDLQRKWAAWNAIPAEARQLLGIPEPKERGT